MSGSKIAEAATVGESTKFVLRTKDEAAMGEVRAGTRSSTAEDKEMLGAIEDDMRGCEPIDDPEMREVDGHIWKRKMICRYAASGKGPGKNRLGLFARQAGNSFGQPYFRF